MRRGEKNPFFAYNVIDLFFFVCKGRHILVNAAADWHIWSNSNSPHVLLEKKDTLH